MQVIKGILEHGSHAGDVLTTVAILAAATTMVSHGILNHVILSMAQPSVFMV